MPLPKPPETWVLVADAENALIFELAERQPEQKLKLVKKLNLPHDPATEPADRQGRRPDGGPGHRSAVGEADHGEAEKAAHAKSVVEMLLGDLRKGAFERLIVIAPPRMLGMLRGAYPSELARAVDAEIAEDLVRHTVPEIAARLPGFPPR